MKSLFSLPHSLVLQPAYDVAVGRLAAASFAYDAELSGKDSGSYGCLNQLVSLSSRNAHHVPLHWKESNSKMSF